MKKTLIPMDDSIESIRVRERIIRDFYREWKEKNPSQRKYNLNLKEFINIRMVSIVETSEHAAKTFLSTLAVLYNRHQQRMKKRHRKMPLSLPQMREGGLR